MFDGPWQEKVNSQSREIITTASLDTVIAHTNNAAREGIEHEKITETLSIPRDLSPSLAGEG